MDVDGRRPEHRRNDELEAVLAELARDLEPAARDAVARHATPRLPLVLIVGCPRAGTTLAYQWLAAGGGFAYPSNLTARFPSAPWIGARVERLLADPACAHGEEMACGDLNPTPYRSRLGKTRGPAAPHEFWYFWRRHLPAGETHALDAAQLAHVDVPRLRAELAAWEDVRRRPLLLKAMILNWNLPWLAQTLPTAVMLHVRRDDAETARSLLAARRAFSGDESRWYSFRPPAWTRLRGLDPVAQVAGQALHTRLDVEDGLARIPAGRRLTVDYDELCDAPERAYARLRSQLAPLGALLPDYAGPRCFPRPVRAPEPSLDDALARALHAERDALIPTV
ncbi:MAG TPA: sulfotransferase [Candidatus Krumholzibacteria bacterium]|nr:sulfotransferase [Candidatus Krumholzibacteria bacterium]